MPSRFRGLLDILAGVEQPPIMIPIPAPRHRADTESTQAWDFIPRHGASIDHQDTEFAARFRANVATPVARAFGHGPVLSRAQKRIDKQEALR